MNQQLKNYIETALAQGHSEEKIKEKLANSGYEQGDIDEAMKSATQKKPGYFLRLAKTITDPKQFFETIKDEEGLTKPTIFLAITLLIYTSVNALLLFAFPKIFTKITQTDITNQAALTIIIGTIIIPALTTMLLSYLTAAAIHFFARILGGEGGFEATYKTLAYSSAVIIPGTIISITPIIGPIITIIWQLAIMIVGTEILHKLKFSKALITVTAPLIILATIILAAMFAIGMFWGQSQQLDLPPPPQLPGQSGLATNCEQSQDTDGCYSELAQTNNNAQLCDKVNDQDRKTFCIAAIGSNTQNKELCSTAPDTDSCFDTYALITKDQTACRLIQNEAKRNNCEEFSSKDI